MRMMFVVDRLDEGGAGRVVSRISNQFVKNNEVIILTLQSKNIEYDICENVKVIYIDSFFNIKTSLKVKRLKSIIEEYNPSIVISFLAKINIFTIMACKKAKVKIIVSERNNPAVTPNSILKRVVRNHFYKKANGWVFQTDRAKDYFCKKIRCNGVIIINPIDDNLPIRDNVDPNKVISVGRLVKQKNYEMTINSFLLYKLKNKESKLYIYGEGPERENIEKLILDKKLDGSVILKGNVNNIYAEMKDANIFIMTSFYEGLSNALLEALAIGIPCVVTDESNGGARKLIKNGENGFLVEINDCVDFSEKMDIASHKMNDYFSKNSILIRKEAGIEKITELWEEYIKKVISN